MQAFKVYFKILKSIYPILLIYSIIFFGIAIMASTSNSNSSATNFEASKPKIVLINYDGNTPLMKTFKKYLAENTTIIDIDDDEEKLSDALFYRQVFYIIKVPINFTKNFMEQTNPKLETLKVPEATTSIYIESLVDKFFNSARLYVTAGIDEKTLSTQVIKNLAVNVDVEVQEANKNNNNLANANYYFNFTNYIFLALLILVIGLIMQAFNELNIKRRNLCSPVKLSTINFQLMLGNFSVTFLIWLLFVIGSIVLYGPTMFTINGLLLILNSFVFILPVLSISFLVGNLVKNIEAQSAIANVISLGSSFICGAFVPQMFLGKGVLLLGSLFPSYWFVKANDLIGTTTSFSKDNVNTIIMCMSIELAFAVAIYFSTIWIGNYRRRKI